MSLELTALYNIHRNQILLNAKDAHGEYRFPEAYLYAVANDIYPALHETWCAGEDPYVDLYEISEERFKLVTEYINEFVSSDKPVPTFYDVERHLNSREFRFEVVRILRYCYLDRFYEVGVFHALLKQGEHPAEAQMIVRDFVDDEMLLI